MYAGKKIVFLGGVWDLFHIGHLNVIKEAKKYGDILIVAVSTDELLESYKNIRPVFPFEDRFAIISALNDVDIAVKQISLADISLMKSLKVDVFVTGEDWKGRNLPGYQWLEKTGKEIVYLPRTKGISTSIIRQKLSKMDVK